VAAVGSARGGALLKALHEKRRVLSGDVESSELLEFLLTRTAVPFLEMLNSWVTRGVCTDPYGEFMVVERPSEARDDLVTDFNCQYWQRRFTLDPKQVPAFLEPHASGILTTGKSLHVVRECGRVPEEASEMAGGGGGGGGIGADVAVFGAERGAALTLEERSLVSRLKSASAWAAGQLVELLMVEHQLMARLESVKHYFLLDQGDFFIHFLDSAEEELTKPVGEISRARLQAKLDLSLRQSAVADPFRDSLTCGLLPYNLTNQLLRIINASSKAAPPAAPQAASRTPGLDAFTFEYEVGWPLSLVLSKHAITKYQLLFRHLFHCKHVERQLSSSWLSQQEPKQLFGMSTAFTASFGLRQRMLHFLFNIQHYMMFEVIEPNWHVLSGKLRAATSLDALLQHHAEFLDASLRECMLRDAVLLKLLAKLLTICVIFADQTRIVMADVAALLAASPLPRTGEPRRARLRELSASVVQTIAECSYHQNVVKLAAKFDEELKRLLDELRRQAHREWNLAHLCSRLDYNSYWVGHGHATLGAAASLSASASATQAPA
jgi:gamma-tubulin complex component 2